MKRHLATSLIVPPGAEVVVTIGGETFVHRVGSANPVHVEISERVGDPSQPEIGAPSLAEHAKTVAEMGLKTRG